MRLFLFVLIAACSSAPTPAPSAPATPSAAAPVGEQWCIQKIEDSDGHLVFLTSNLALRGYADKAAFPFLVHINVTTQEQNANGHPTDREAEVLNAVEDAITPDLVRANTGVFVGRATTKGFRELMYYVRDAEQATTILSRLAAGEKQRPWEFRVENDASWQRVEGLLAADAECM